MTEPTFETCLHRTLEIEDGYSNHPADPGGPTRYGITEKVARRWGYTGDMKELPLDLAKEIYEVDYWRVAKCPLMPPALACQVFDAAVNHGVEQSLQFLQTILGVKPDGIWGPKSQAALANAPVIGTTLLFVAQRGEFFIDLRNWPTYGRGWTKRAWIWLRYALADLGLPTP